MGHLPKDAVMSEECMRLGLEYRGVGRVQKPWRQGAPIADIALLSDFHFLLFGPVDMIDLSSVIAAQRDCCRARDSSVSTTSMKGI